MTMTSAPRQLFTNFIRILKRHCREYKTWVCEPWLKYAWWISRKIVRPLLVSAMCYVLL